jgi:hypothetical protein
MTNPLIPLAARVENDPFFLASALALYARSEELDDPALAARLGCPVEQLPRLRLCRMPRTDPAGFREDIAVLAGHFHLDELVLIEALKRGRVIQRLQGAARAEGGVLMAARDREPQPPPDTEAP